MICNRWLMSMYSATFVSELFMMTAPASPGVTSLFRPFAISAVAAIITGASLIPSPP